MYFACYTVYLSSTTVYSTIWAAAARKPSSRWLSWTGRSVAPANASEKSAPECPRVTSHPEKDKALTRRNRGTRGK